MDIGAFAKAGLLKQMHTGDIIFNFNDPSQEVYLLIDGEVTITAKNQTGQTAIVSIMKKNSLFRKYESINGNSCKTSAKVTHPCKYVAFPCNLYIKIKGELPSANFTTTTTPEIAILFPNSAQESLNINGINDLTNILPEGHPQYDLIEHGETESYTYNKENTCPLCETEFQISSIRNSKLRSTKTDADFRPHYDGFEPTWYAIYVCPQCGYANLAREYQKLSSVQKTIIKEKCCHKYGSFTFSQPRKIDDVIAAHHMALCSCETGSMDEAVKARIWHNLAWLYSDAGDDTLYKQAIEKALSCYMKAFYGTAKDTSIETEQKAHLLIGAMNMIIQDYKEASRHFYSAINRKMGNKVFNTMAEDKLDEAKSALANEETEPPEEQPS